MKSRIDKLDTAAAKCWQKMHAVSLNEKTIPQDQLIKVPRLALSMMNTPVNSSLLCVQACEFELTFEDAEGDQPEKVFAVLAPESDLDKARAALQLLGHRTL